jgi:flagellar motor switch protein FliN
MADEKKNEEKAPASPAELKDVGSGKPAGGAGSIDMLMDVSLNVRIELGRTHMTVEEIVNLQGGSVVTLDRLAGEPVDVLVNNKLVARGEVLVLNDKFCIRVTEIMTPEQRAKATKG